MEFYEWNKPPSFVMMEIFCLLVQTLNSDTPGAWDAIHALSYHTYATDLGSIQSAASSLNQQFGKPVWVTEIAAGGGASMDTNIALMEAFVPWANSQGWIERYFWNQAVSPFYSSLATWPCCVLSLNDAHTIPCACA